MKITFEVLGKPQAKGRPRFARMGGFVKTYTPKETLEYENKVKLAYLSQIKGQDYKEYAGQVKVSIWAYFEPIKSISKKKYNEILGTAHLKRPDLDNIQKSILDGLNGVAWKDDSQIYNIQAYKYYDKEEKVIVEIEYE